MRLFGQVMKDISEVRKAMDTTQEMFEPLHQMIVMLKQHGVDVSGVQVAEKDVQVHIVSFRTRAHLQFSFAIYFLRPRAHFQYFRCRKIER